MWRPPFDRPLPPPQAHGHPSHGPERGYSAADRPPAHYAGSPHRADYHHRPLYPHHRPPPPPQYDYRYGHSPAYSPHYHPPQAPLRPYYESSPLSEHPPASAALPLIGGGCTCKKSKCLKLYCQCFSSSTTCGPKCKCQTCHNTTMHREDIEDARKVILERNPAAFDIKNHPIANPTPPTTPTKSGCKCRRSFCLKKYCECFNHGTKCAGTCRCVNCRNQPNAAPEAGPYVQAQKPSPSPRRVTDTSTTQQEKEQDRMAIMAAIAMTELFGCKRGLEDVSNVTTEASTSVDTSSNKKIRTHGSVIHSSGTAVETQGTYADDDERAIVSSSSSSNVSSPETIQPSPRASPITIAPFGGTFYGLKDSRSSLSARVYEETTRLSGLPKSLSFRKICSKCGKTRGEHGELGFGHRCVYQDCGKCGAGIHMHVKANVSMGILCTLSEKDGATPGRAEAYERKIQDLAVRAELQQKLQQQHRLHAC